MRAQFRGVQNPESTVPRLEALTHRMLTGDVILPKVQRQFVLSRQQTLDLLDPVSRNYPISSVLLWQSTERLASERTVAGLAVEPQCPGYPVNYIQVIDDVPLAAVIQLRLRHVALRRTWCLRRMAAPSIAATTNTHVITADPT